MVWKKKRFHCYRTEQDMVGREKIHTNFSSSSAFPSHISLGFTILLLLPSPAIYLWASPFFFFCLPQPYISGLHHSSSSAFPSHISLGFTILLLLHSPVLSLGFTILGQIFAYVTVFIQPLRQSHSILLDGACWVFVVSIHLSRT